MNATSTFDYSQAFQSWKELTSEEQSILKTALPEERVRDIQRLYEASKAAETAPKTSIEPLRDNDVTLLGPDHDADLDGYNTGSEARKEMLQVGLKLVSEGKVAVLCLAGGQGTRLGSSDPKGMFDIGLPSGKSLFQIQAERIYKLERVAAEAVGADPSNPRQIPWIILTSPATDAKTREYFQQSNCFSLAQSQIHFIVQDELPALTLEGKIILDSRTQGAMAPNGNGGIYQALTESGMLDKLERDGVEYIDTYCVDNALVRLADPHFVGHVHLLQGDVGAKVIAKAYPTERVGVFAIQKGVVGVVEYSELDPEKASAADPSKLHICESVGTGKLYYNWSNISSFLFTPRFVRKAAGELRSSGQYHIARKCIKSFQGPIQGVKLEAFIFDTLHLAERLVVLEVNRAAHFAPVKNANGASNDTPDTARQAVLELHRRWLKGYGFESTHPNGTEISPLDSYMGEGLELWAAQQNVTAQRS